MANGTLKAFSRLARWRLRLNPLWWLPRYLEPRSFCYSSNIMTSAQDTSEVAVDTSAQPPTQEALTAAADRLVPVGSKRSCGHKVNKNGSCGGKGCRTCDVSKDCVKHRKAATKSAGRGKKRKSADADLPQFSVAGAAAAAAAAPSNAALQPVDYTQRCERH